MGAVWLSPLYLLLNFYLLARILPWFSTLHTSLHSLWFAVPFAILFSAAALTPLTAAFSHGALQRFSKKFCNYWLGVLMYLLLFLLPADLVRCVLCLMQRRSVFSPVRPDLYRAGGAVLLCAVALITGYGVWNASRLRKTVWDVTVHKNPALPPLKIALVADLHLGYSVGLRRVKQTAELLNSMHPDLVVYAGDLFDNDFDAIESPKEAAALLSSVKSRYGSFACWGNHDVPEVILAGFTFDSGNRRAGGDPRMIKFFRNANIRLLEDETVLIDGVFYLCGRLDASCKVKSGIIRKTPTELTEGLDHTKPVFVIDHQPSQLRELAAAGADLDLSGHTHDGQLFPGNLTTRIGWQNSWGKLVVGNMTSIVTSGAGVWGPPMRIGTFCEVAEVNVSFQKSSGGQADL